MEYVRMWTCYAISFDRLNGVCRYSFQPNDHHISHGDLEFYDNPEMFEIGKTCKLTLTDD